MRIVQISDTHISHLGGAPSDNMSLLIDHVNNELRPDLVVHTGDVVIANPDSAQDHKAAWSLVQKLDAPVHVLPGNHDVGESAARPWMELPVTSNRIAAFAKTWGQDRFFLPGSPATRSADWIFIGLNSERFSSGLPEEQEQWAWLADAAEQARDKSLMLFLHKPLWYPDAWPTVTIAPADRGRLLSLFAGTRLRAVASGHVHRHRRSLEGDILTVWAPSLTFALPADPERGLGPSEPAIVEYVIDGDAIEAHERAVPGLARVDNASEMPEMKAAMAEISPDDSDAPLLVTTTTYDPRHDGRGNGEDGGTDADGGGSGGDHMGGVPGHVGVDAGPGVAISARRRPGRALRTRPQHHALQG